MEATDPATGQPLPADAIQRVLFIAPRVHIYNIPPMASTKGHTAAAWTADPKRQIFTARLRVVETALSSDDSSSVSTTLVLEDPSNGQLFAAAPYTSPEAVEPAIDSARFFALRVQDGSGRKANLGIGFEERPEAFDFGVALQEARKALGMESRKQDGGKKVVEEKKEEVKRDYSLKEGETITVTFGGGSKLGKRAGTAKPETSSGSGLGGFSLAPPPSAASFKGGSLLPPPPPAGTSSQGQGAKKAAKDMGFDDGQFGEFA